MSKTIICDIDGTLLFHHGDILNQHLCEPTLLPGVADQFREWEREGNTIILITARKESTRSATIAQLNQVQLIYDHLIMGVSNGSRLLINDVRLDNTSGAESWNVKRNGGL